MDIKEIIKKVKQIEIRTKRRSEASLMGQYHSAFKGQGMTFAEVMPYQIGDEIRRIDWNKTARFQEPYVKVMEEERELTVILLVDVSASMDYGTHVAKKREFVASVCASIGFSATGNNDKVGLVLFADKVYKVIPPKKGRKHVLSILSQILSHPYISTKSDLDYAMEYVMKVFRKKSFVFMFSDFQDEFNQRTLQVTAKKHSLLGLRILDEKDIEIPDIGYALVRDVETGSEMWVNTSSKRWRYNYKEAQRSKEKEVLERFDNSSAGILNMKTGDNYAKMLSQYFKNN